MSEKKGPFDAAIKSLQFEPHNVPPLIWEDYHVAIRVLEAAGKVLGQSRENVKQRLILGLDCFTDIKDDEKSENGWWKSQIRALLESLPEPEKEKK